MLMPGWPACHAKPRSTEEGTELSTSQGETLLTHPLGSQRSKGFSDHIPTTHGSPPRRDASTNLPPRLCHGTKSGLVVIDALIYHSLKRELKCVLYVW